MLQFHTPPPDVFSGRELAQAAGVPVARVRDLVASGAIRSIDGEFVLQSEALRAGRALMAGLPLAAAVDAPAGDRPIFSPPHAAYRAAGLPLAVSSTLHAALIAGVVFITTVGMTQTEAITAIEKAEPVMRMVFLALPGPGGGGGGGGLRQKPPPPQAELKGRKRLSSPMPIRRPPPQMEAVKQPVDPPKPPELKHEALPPIVAPIVTAPADARDRIGVLEQTTAQNDSRGPGSGGGVGSGTGTGIGPGDGSGIGEGSGGGTGGGPYRPGSGIEPPRLLREVRPNYTEEARQRGVEGDVVLEIVVRRDGTVGDVQILQGLGFGLDRLAADAVRQWRFSPARRLGRPVDVVVEVAVEFKLR
jgi:protein TonB